MRIGIGIGVPSFQSGVAPTLLDTLLGITEAWDDLWVATDGVTGDPVATWTGQVNARTLTEATNRPDFEATKASLNGKPTLAFDGANDVLTAGAAASVYKRLHSADAGLVVVVDDQDDGTLGTVVNTGNIQVATQTGLYFARFGNDLFLRVGNGSGTYVANATISTVAKGAAIYVLTFGSGNILVHRNGTEIADITHGDTPSTGNPLATLGIGLSSAGTNPFKGSISAVGVLESAPNTATRQAIEEALSVEYGIPLA